jgi:hypothetical protein
VSFWRGFVTAILVLEWLALGWLVRAAPMMERMVADFGPVELPRIFLVVTSTEYAIGCLVGLVVAASIAGWVPRKPGARVAGLACVAIVGAVLVAVTWYGLYSPIFELSGKIR